ncbi:MAG: hypothetical protein FJW30_05530 [Acidobacteria bacterium]|nr:hypothetical protein [Acidobacteriota bacterium]
MLAALLLLAADPANLIRKAIEAGELQSAKEWTFTWREEVEDRRPNAPNSVETFEVIMLEGENYRKLVLVNGQPLDAKRQMQVDQDMAKERDKRKKRSFGTIRRSVRSTSLETLQKLFDCKLAGEDVQGIRIDCEPKPGYKAANKDERDALSMRSSVWFDKSEGVERKRLDHFVRAANGFQPGSEIEVEYAKFGEAWLPSSLRFRYDLKAMTVVRVRGEKVYRYFDYRRFQVESTLLPAN